MHCRTSSITKRTHRGQVHCLLTKTVEEAPSLDLILYQRETGLGLS